MAKKKSIMSYSSDIIPIGVWGVIGSKLQSYWDRVHFRRVCKSWRSLLPPLPHPPCLLLNEAVGSDQSPPCRHFMRLGSHQVYKLEFPEIHRAPCIGSAGNWIITEDGDKKVRSTNLFSRVQTQLLPDDGISMGNEIFNKVVLSCTPSEYDGQNCTGAVAIYNCGMELGFVRPGGTSWTTFILRDGDCILAQDIIFHDQEFYVVDLFREIMVLNIGDHQNPPTYSITEYGDNDESEDDNNENQDGPSPFAYKCFVEWLGALLVIHIIHPYIQYKKRGWKMGKANMIKVYKLDIINKTLEEVKSLGEHSLFLGLHRKTTCYSALASDYYGLVRKNCIYFVENSEDGGVKYDVSVFDMEDKSVSNYYRGLPGGRYWGSPPVWILPTRLFLF